MWRVRGTIEQDAERETQSRPSCRRCFTIKSTPEASFFATGDFLSTTRQNGVMRASGRYRFAWNTFVQTSSATTVIQGFDPGTAGSAPSLIASAWDFPPAPECFAVLEHKGCTIELKPALAVL